MKIDRVILASDENPLYIQFWPLAARAWSLLGIKPTLFLISESMEVDETVGDVIRIKPIPGVPTPMQAQCIRLLGPTMFTDEICATSDIDMMPLSESYFVEQISDIPNDRFVVFCSDAYENIPNFPCFPMAYNVALGSTYREVFKHTIGDFEETIKRWHKLGHGWTTDERVLYFNLKTWKNYKEKSVLLRRGFVPNMHNMLTARIDRSNMQFDQRLILNQKYADFHMPRPYEENKQVIDIIFSCFETSVNKRKKK